MPFKVTLTGWTELQEALWQLPQQFTGEAATIVRDAGDTTAAQLQAAYPPGELRDKVRVTFAMNRFGAISTVNSASQWAPEWEFGTNSRQTQQGWNRGAEPAHPDRGLLTIARQQGRVMNRRLADMVTAAGFKITGS